jgi:hypothetical protein
MAVVISAAVGTEAEAEAGVASEVINKPGKGTVIGVGAGTAIGIAGERRAVSEVRTALRVGMSLPASMTTRQVLVIGLISFGFGTDTCYQAYLSHAWLWIYKA